MKKAILLAAAVACTPCIDWTRFSGIVKAVNLKSSTVTIQLKGGDLVTIPVDFQVSLQEKHDELRALKDLKLDETVTLLRVPRDAPPAVPEDTTGMAQPEKR
jgi:hypothetical protein